MSKHNYSDFAYSCVQYLMELQEKFRNDFDCDSYDNWFYNDSTGLITFSSEDKEINFKYLTVGTFSRNTSTWKWSWDNEQVLPLTKKDISVVKDFGRKSGFEKLTDCYFESTEVEAWEFAAITAKLIDGIGVYRPVSDHLLVFMVVQEFVDTEIARRIKNKYVECNRHEYKRRAFVCHHLNHHKKVGFEESFETYEYMELGEEDDFQAWCTKCERLRRKAKGWNDSSMEFADIKLVCEQCYFDMKELNIGWR